MMIFVSACLMGDNCKYNGGNNYNSKVAEFLKDKEYIKICPEMSGGLSIPRNPAEIVNSHGGKRVLSSDGRDVTENFIKGAENTLRLAEKYNPELIIFKAKSPSCGKGEVYDGTFSKTLTKGNGITAELLLRKGYKVITEKEITDCQYQAR